MNNIRKIKRNMIDWYLSSFKIFLKKKKEHSDLKIIQ